MLMRCAKCGKPVYATPSSKRTGCRFCYETAPFGRLQSLEPHELDWRKPLYHTATSVFSGEASLRRLAPLGDYAHAAQRIDLYEKEIALEKEQGTVETQEELENEEAGESPGAHSVVDAFRGRLSTLSDAVSERLND